MLEVFTIGGGEYVVNVLNAVAAWSGSGGFRGLIQVVLVMGLAYSLVVTAFSLDWRAWFTWFLQTTMIYGMLLVPSVTVKVTDRINPSLAPAVVANVPLGLGIMASFTSQIGDYLTRTAETIFVMPAALSMSNNGIVYGARLFDKAQTFQITNSEFRANLDEHLKQCTFYDVMLGFKSMDQFMRSQDIWAAVGPGSPARGQKWINVAADGTSTSEVLTCEQAYTELDRVYDAQVEADMVPFAKTAFPKLANAYALEKLKADLPIAADQLHGSSASNAIKYLRQVSMIDAFRAARESFSSADWDAYASQRAEAQARNTYTSIAQQAMTWVPVLNVVLTVVFYAMFLVIFPLFLFPRTGVATLKGYATGFFYLASWGPLYVVLHMFVMNRAADAVAAVAPGGPTLLVTDGIQAVNNDIATVAGFLMMSVPFLAAGMAKGALAISGQATSMLAPAQSAAEAAAVERTTGNYAYGNTSFANTTANMMQANKWDTTSHVTGGFASSSYQNADGTTTGYKADGAIVYNSSGGMSVLPVKPTVNRGWVSEARETASSYFSQAEQLREQASESFSRADRLSHGVSSGSRAAAGLQSSAGSESGTNISQYDRNGTSSSSGTSEGRDISQGLQLTEGQNDRYSAAANTNASARAGVGGGGGRGGTGGGGLGGRLGALIPNVGGSLEYGRSASDGVQFDRGTNATRGDTSRHGTSSSVQDDHSNGRDVQTNSGTYEKSGSFSSNERFTSDTTTSEQAYEHGRRLSLEAAKMEDRGRRLEEAASYAESHGFTLNEDMSQYLTSRYLDLQHGEMQSLNLPDLHRTNLNAEQREARQAAITKVMREFVDAPRAGVAERLVEPDTLDVQGPSSFTREDLRAGLAAPTRSVGGSGGVPGSGAAAEIAAGREELQGERSTAQAMHGQAVIGSSEVQAEHGRRTNKEWFSERK